MTAPTITLTRDGRAVLAFPYDAAFIESLKATVPGYARVYDPAVKTWTVTPAYADVAARLMFATFADVEIEGPPRSGPSDRAPRAGDAYRVLHLLPSAPPELVTAAHRCLAKLHHPDRGGSTATMQALNNAVDRIREVS